VETELSRYFPVLLLLLLAVVFAGGMLLVSVLLGKKGRRSAVKDSAYECGMIPEGTGGVRMSIKFYLIALLFILFDIEVVILYPWAVVYREMLQENANLVFGSFTLFLGILFVGEVYALKKRAFDWRD